MEAQASCPLSIVLAASGNENVLFALANSVLHSASDSVVYTPDMTINLLSWNSDNVSLGFIKSSNDLGMNKNEC